MASLAAVEVPPPQLLAEAAAERLVGGCRVGRAAPEARRENGHRWTEGAMQRKWRLLQMGAQEHVAQLAALKKQSMDILI